MNDYEQTVRPCHPSAVAAGLAVAGHTPRKSGTRLLPLSARPTAAEGLAYIARHVIRCHLTQDVI